MCPKNAFLDFFFQGDVKQREKERLQAEEEDFGSSRIGRHRVTRVSQSPSAT